MVLFTLDHHNYYAMLMQMLQLTDEQIYALTPAEQQAIQLLSVGVFSFSERLMILVLTAELSHGSREHDRVGFLSFQINVTYVFLRNNVKWK